MYLAQRGGMSSEGMDVQLIGTFFLWFLGNYYYNIWNKQCLKVQEIHLF